MTGRKLRDRNMGRRSSDSAWRIVAAAAILVAIVATVTAVGSQKAANRASTVAQQADKNSAAVAKSSENLLRSEIFTCRRVQALRNEVNSQGETIYRVLVAASLVGSSDARRAYRYFADQLDYLPRTDCRRAVNDPSYTRPPPVTWRKKLGPRPSPPAGLVPKPPETG